MTGYLGQSHSQNSDLIGLECDLTPPGDCQCAGQDWRTTALEDILLGSPQARCLAITIPGPPLPTADLLRGCSSPPQAARGVLDVAFPGPFLPRHIRENFSY